MKRTTLLAVACATCMLAQARSLPFGKGRLTVTPLAPNAVRIQYSESASQLPEFCADVRVADPAFFAEGKYLFREMPAIYLLDRNGTVLLKEVRLQSVVETVKSR